MALCCGAHPGNWLLRLKKVTVFCLANDCIAVGFYSVSAIWGFSRAGLVRDDVHECYLGMGYAGHIVASVFAGVTAIAASLGVVLAARMTWYLGSVLQEGTAISSESRLRASLAAQEKLRGTRFLRDFLIVFSFEVVWMWIVYATEVFVGFTLPLEECHPGRAAAPRARGAGVAFVQVFFLGCWGFSCAMRATAVFFAYEVLYSKAWPECRQQEAHVEDTVMGRPVTFGSMQPTVVPAPILGNLPGQASEMDGSAQARPPAVVRGGGAVAPGMPVRAPGRPEDEKRPEVLD